MASRSTRSIDDALASTGEEEIGAGFGIERAYLTIAHIPGDGDQLLDEYRKYSDVMSQVGRDHGLILHAGAKAEDGFLIVNLWPSKEESEAAARDPRRLGVLERTEIRPDQIRREHHQVAQFVVFG